VSETSQSATVRAIQRLGDFELVEKLGAGGMGTVYRAVQVSMDREVAVKVLHEHLASDHGLVERFYREARTAGKLDHPGIVRGLSVGEDQGRHYFAMEFVAGESLDAVLQKRRRLPIRESVALILHLARALDHAHGKGMIHRDVKPANIMVGADGTVKLTDLGLAKVLQGSNVTLTGEVFGTPAYMAPEQALNPREVDGRADIYALGVTLYRLITGAKPFPAESLSAIAAREKTSYTPARQYNPLVPESLEAVINKMLAARPERRFQTAAELITALEAVELPEEVTKPVSATIGRPSKRRTLRASTLAALAGLIVAVGFYFAWQQLGERPQPIESGTEETNDEVIGDALLVATAGQPNRAISLLADRLPKTAGSERLMNELSEGLLIAFQHQGADEASLLAPMWSSDGVTLTGRDGYRFAFVPRRECYVYAFQVDEKPSVAILFPNEKYGPQQNPLPAGEAVWLPHSSEGNSQLWLRLDQQPGVERVYFLAVDKALSDPTAFAHRLVAASGTLSSTASRKELLRDAMVTGTSCFATEETALSMMVLNHR
jgi:serine/threonine protein kinase